MESNGGSVSQVPMKLNDEGAIRLLKQATAMLAEKYQSTGSWFALVPDAYKDAVRNLAEYNFPSFSRKFKNNLHCFLEEMSRNWLLKFYAFEELAQASGFTASVNGCIARNEQVNRAGIVCLTRSGSYFLIGPGSCGTGAAMKYVRIPFRKMDLRQEETFQGGVLLEADVRNGMRLLTNELSSSPLISFFTRQFEEGEGDVIPKAMRKFDENTTRCFVLINAQTLE